MRSASEKERGSGLVAAIGGVVVVLAFVLLAVQLLVNLTSTSVVTSAGYDAARMVATAPSQPATRDDVARADAHARRLLGGYEDPPTLEWDLSDADFVRLRIRVTNPRFLWSALAGPLGLDVVDRTLVVRVERFQ